MTMRFLGALLAAVLWLLAPPAMSAAAAPSLVAQNPTTFDTVADMRQAPELSGTVTTRGHTSAGDGGAMTYQVSATRPDHGTGAMAVPLADGKWAVPTGLSTQPPRPADSTAAADAISRATSFASAGRDLIWDPTRTTPLSGSIIHQRYSKPYALTCSSFVGMVLQGWDYSHTTYVADRNTVVGFHVDFGSSSDLWQAHKLARWFVGHGDAWLITDRSQLRPGDVLFFSAPTDEALGGDYFGNVYHTGIYLGEGRIIHSYGVESGAGVVEATISDAEWNDLVLVARPQWTGGAPAMPVPSPTPPTPSPEAAPPPSAAPSTSADPSASAQPSASASPSPSSTPSATIKSSPETTQPEAEPVTPSESPDFTSAPASIAPVFAIPESPDDSQRLTAALGVSGALLGGGVLIATAVWRRRH